jgi:hypothetical protein
MVDELSDLVYRPFSRPVYPCGCQAKNENIVYLTAIFSVSVGIAAAGQ